VKTARDYVTKYPDVTLSMAQQKIAAMKARVNELVYNAEETVRGELDNHALWCIRNRICMTPLIDTSK